ncbi:hypothetical protein C8J56DRAFT_884322 [Mycena floridula]|nr:hypothetical protein C8J56DRAFT_884322 [Mycena floridula]
MVPSSKKMGLFLVARANNRQPIRKSHECSLHHKKEDVPQLNHRRGTTKKDVNQIVNDSQILMSAWLVFFLQGKQNDTPRAIACSNEPPRPGNYCQPNRRFSLFLAWLIALEKWGQNGGASRPEKRVQVCSSRSMERTQSFCGEKKGKKPNLKRHGAAGIDNPKAPTILYVEIGRVELNLGSGAERSLIAEIELTSSNSKFVMNLTFLMTEQSATNVAS